MTYAEKLRDPRWQKKRLEVMQRDGFTCQRCYDDEHTLHVHHRRYVFGLEPWDYPMSALVTLCADCHQTESDLMQDELNLLSEAMRDQFFANEVHELAAAVHYLRLGHPPEVVMSAIVFMLGKGYAQMMDAYFADIKSRTNHSPQVPQKTTEEASHVR